jgi:hypothetical protein
MLKLLTAKFKGRTRARLIRKRPELIKLLPKISYSKPTVGFSNNKFVISSFFTQFQNKNKLPNLFCSKCGSSHKVQMYPVNSKKIASKDVLFENFLKRKQIPFCKNCFNEMHKFF